MGHNTARLKMLYGRHSESYGHLFHWKVVLTETLFQLCSIQYISGPKGGPEERSARILGRAKLV